MHGTQPVPSSRRNLRNLGLDSRETTMPRISAREIEERERGREKEGGMVGYIVRDRSSATRSLACAMSM